MKTVDEFFKRMPDPRNVEQSEYALVWDAVETVWDMEFDDEEDPEAERLRVLQSSLTQLEAQVQSVQIALNVYMQEA